jgi:hypothetical protein
MGVVSQMLRSSNVLISLSELETCMVIAGLYTVKGKQVDESYRQMVQKLIDKIAKVEPVDNR